jgi:hypothetical protein
MMRCTEENGGAKRESYRMEVDVNWGDPAATSHPDDI